MSEKEIVKYHSFDRYVCVKGTGYEEELKKIENLYYQDEITLEEFDKKCTELFNKIKVQEK